MSEPRLIESIEVPALVKVKGAWFYLLATTGELILDYAAYDPSHDPGYLGFRGGMYTVAPGDGLTYLAALGEAVFGLDEVAGFIEMNGSRSRPVATIDFDAKTYTSTYLDIEMEMYVGEGWTAAFEDPFGAVPPSVASLWS